MDMSEKILECQRNRANRIALTEWGIEVLEPWEKLEEECRILGDYPTPLTPEEEERFVLIMEESRREALEKYRLWKEEQALQQGESLPKDPDTP